MADINEELLRALNGPAPQHKKYGEQAFEFTEGEQGKLFTGNHVMTDSGIWVPQKGTNDGAVNTQLTGSIEEIYRQTSAEELQPSETWRVLDNEINRYKNISVFLRRVPSVDVSLRFLTRSEPRGSFVNQVNADVEMISYYVSAFQDKGVGIVYLIELINVSSEPITVSDIVIMGGLT